MTHGIDFICLANSRKLSGRCVAGLRTDGNGWIRPVSDLEDGRLVEEHYTLDDGCEAQLLDVVRVEVVKPQVLPHQPENWILAKKPWKLLRRISPADAMRHLEPALIPGPDLLGNRSDRVAVVDLKKRAAASSLALVAPESLEWTVTKSMRGNRQIRAVFELRKTSYDLVVTDPRWERRLSSLQLGTHPREAASLERNFRVLFTVSLSEPFEAQAHCFKLVAGVLVLPAAREVHR